MIIGPLLLLVLVSALWLYIVGKFTICALPCSVGLGVSQIASQTGAGDLASIIVGVVTALASYALMRASYHRLGGSPLRWVIAAAFSVFPAVVGFNLVSDLLRADATEAWRLGLSVLGGGLAAWLAFRKLATDFQD